MTYRRRAADPDDRRRLHLPAAGGAARVPDDRRPGFLALTLPGGLLDIYHEVGIPAAERRLPDAGVSDADVARWLELAPRYGLRVVGPPISEAEA